MDDQIRPRPLKPVVSPVVLDDGSLRWLCALRPRPAGAASAVGIGSSVDAAYQHWLLARLAAAEKAKVGDKSGCVLWL